MSVNKVILLGRVGRDPEVKYLDNNKVVATFSLATSENYKDRNGQNVEQTEWHNIEMWDNLAKLAEKYVKKGKMLYIEGKIRTNKWTDRETNQEKQSKLIRATDMTFINTGQGGGDNQGGGNYGGGGNNYGNNQGNDSGYNRPANNDDAPVPQPMPDDDLPF